MITHKRFLYLAVLVCLFSWISFAQDVIIYDEEGNPIPLVIYPQEEEEPIPPVYQEEEEEKPSPPIIYHEEEEPSPPPVYIEEEESIPPVYQEEEETRPPIIYPQEEEESVPPVYQEEEESNPPIIYQEEEESVPPVYQEEEEESNTPENQEEEAITEESGNGGFPGAVIDQMSSREERYHHFLWHYIRDNWNRFDEDTQDEIRDRGWRPPRPSRRYDENGNSIAITDNNSGEDFLYFHRQMIAKVRELGGEIEALRGWRRIPAPDDEDYPVPDQYEIPGSPSTTDVINERKSDEFYFDRMVPVEDRFTDRDELRSMTLGELGSRVENTIHNWLHLRFSSESSVGYRPGTGGAFPSINERWDDSDYDWLGDTYSSHVNPLFWKLHGWVDDRIEDWREANGIDEIEWIGTWEGGPMSEIRDILEGQGDQADNGEAGDLVATAENIMAPLQVASSFAEEVEVDLGTSAKVVSLSDSDSAQSSTKSKTRTRRSKRCKSKSKSKPKSKPEYLDDHQH